jgi:prevent-host-death family protein
VTKHVPFSEARANLSDLLDLVESKHEHVVISRSGKDVAIVLSVDEFDSLIETLEVLDDPELMAAIAESEEDVKAGRVYPWEQVKRELGLD